jgi:hypothetical protein
MRFFNSLFVLILIFSFAASAQNIIKEFSAKEYLPKSYPIDGSHLLWKQDQAVAKWVKEHPDYLNKNKLSKATSWGFSVGSAHSWYAENLTTFNYYQVPSTCRGIGAHCYVFVADAQWNNKVNQAAVDSVVNEFENKTPANSSKGIYQTDVDTFGNPPDADNDSRIIILILDIQDGYTGSGGYTAGYFSSANEVSMTGSNNAEIYYMDCNPTDLTTSTGLQTALETCAHEFQHMINWNYHQSNSEMTFVNEGCSKVAEVICGYPQSFPALYANETNHYLFDWRSGQATPVLNDYSRAQRYFTYWLDQFGVGIFKDIVQDNQVGLAGLENALTTDGQTISFTQLFVNWLIANKLDDITVNSVYGYPVHTGLTRAVSKITYYNPNVSASGTVAPLGAEYISFTAGSNLNITFSSSSSSIVVKAIEEGSGTSRVLDVPLNTNFSESEYGTTYTSIHFAVINTSLPSDTSSAAYSYSATGTASTAEIELKWDYSNALGYLNFPSGDTLCVVFNEVYGGKIDSVKVGLAKTGSIEGGIWVYNSKYSVTPLQSQLAGPFTASYSGSTWTNIDLTSYNISSAQPFAVAFAVPSSNNPQISVTKTSGTSFANSLTYDGGSWNYYAVSGEDATWQYLIRAYVSLIATGVKQEVELTPASFSLSQNYPNPFNPSTVINFSVPKSGRVRISVYNQLGQQVALIADGDYSSGNHSINFNGASLASGIYYYRIISGSFTQTKKMVLLK